jgi:hypothetical protein
MVDVNIDDRRRRLRGGWLSRLRPRVDVNQGEHQKQSWRGSQDSRHAARRSNKASHTQLHLCALHHPESGGSDACRESGKFFGRTLQSRRPVAVSCCSREARGILRRACGRRMISAAIGNNTVRLTTVGVFPRPAMGLENADVAHTH